MSAYLRTTEAHRAAEIRRLRGKKSWITDDGGDAGVYRCEGASNGPFSVSADAATQSFDEPLTTEQVIAAVQKYVVV